MPRLPVRILASASLALSGCAGDSAPPADLAERPPDVVLIVVDTLRSDRLSCYGYPRETSPVLDRLAEEGVLFEDVTAQGSITMLSMASMMTGRYMTEFRTRYEAEAVPLAELLRQAGYRTIGATANRLLSQRNGFDRGFDFYDEGNASHRRIGALVDGLWEEVDRALAPDASGVRPPLFLYLHVMEPHATYRAYPQLRTELPDHLALDLQPPGWHAETFAELGAPAPEDDPGWTKAWGQIRISRGRYDQEIRYTDEQLGVVLEELRARGVLEHAIVAFAADHGEVLWDRVRTLDPAERATRPPGTFFYQEHGKLLYQELVGTPLVLWGAGVARGRRVDAPVENVDLYPTLVELAGLSPPAGLHGRSLVGLLAGDEAPPRDLHAASRLNWTLREGGTDLKLIVPNELGERAGYRTELYDLARDPHEREDLAAERPEDVARLRAKLEAWRERHPVESTRYAPLDPQTLQDLQALGYADQIEGAEEGED